MEKNKSTENPFASLVGFGDTENKSSQNMDTSGDTEKNYVNNMVRDVFYITIDDNTDQSCYRRGGHPDHLIYLDELAKSVAPQTKIDMEILENALFDRILLTTPSQHVIPKQTKILNEYVTEKDVITYLFTCEQNLFPYLDSSDKHVVDLAKQMQKLILRNAATALKQPALFENQILCDQLFIILKTRDVLCQSFINGIVAEFMADEEGNNIEELGIVIKPIIKLMYADVMKSSLISLNMYVFHALNLFAGNVHLANILLDTLTPPSKMGCIYQNSVFGALLSLSVLPKVQSGKYEYFESAFDKAANGVEEEKLWKSSEHLASSLHKIFLKLLKISPECKEKLLQWISNCLFCNSPRGKLWSSQASAPVSITCVSDAFMQNLSAVLLLLCQPFCQSPNNMKWLTIDPTYCAVEESERKNKGVHMQQMYKETCIIPPREVYEECDGPTRLTAAKSYNFITECFFLAHKSLDLGYRVIAEKLLKLTQELNQIRQTFTEALNSSSDLGSMLDAKLKSSMTRVISIRCVLREPQFLSSLSNLHAATSNWLVQLVAHPNVDNPKKDTYAPLNQIELKFPLNEEEPDALRCVPEFVVENIVCSLTSWQNYNPSAPELLEPVLSLVLVFMGSAKKMRNPHLRARLAECLAALLPKFDMEEAQPTSIASFVREKLFKEHPHRLQIVPSLLHVFVGIEVTGENVQFEQKFNYRRPMYLIMDYLWEIEEHRDCFKHLSKDAEANMEAVTPPIFLRFVNLLMNDAVYLLDEALNNMSQIRTMQAISRTELEQRPANEREEHYHNLRYIGMLARFDNILGRHTIGTLEKLTREINSVFCHPTMVNRIASMLNYFLLHLVGPNQKKFKVKDSKEYEFDPVSTVLNICRIYIHLGDNDDFCAAVSQDGRSYSPVLFKLAEDVLARINGGALISSLITIGERVSKLAQQQLLDEEVLADAPDEFLDPIMSTLMYDPVILPSSKISIDRNTIARHLLSDQSDPFNRSPLSMDQVINNDELKSKIRAWIEQKRREHTSGTS